MKGVSWGRVFGCGTGCAVWACKKVWGARRVSRLSACLRMAVQGDGWLATKHGRAKTQAETAWRGNDDWGVLLANAGGNRLLHKKADLRSHFSTPRCQVSFSGSNHFTLVLPFGEPSTKAQGPSPNSSILLAIQDWGVRGSARITGVPAKVARGALRLASSCLAGAGNS